MRLSELLDEAFKVGDRVKLRFDDQPENQAIVGKAVTIKRVETTSSPFWLAVELDGKEYGIRGKDCMLVEGMSQAEAAKAIGVDEKGNVTILHGTTEANAASIKKGGFKNSDPEAVAHMVEQEYKLKRDSVYDHPSYQFPKKRSDLDEVHFTSKPDVAAQYTVPEQLQDALQAAYSLLHPHHPDAKWKDVAPKQSAWVKAEGKRLCHPEVLVVKIPWTAFGDHAFGRKLTLEEFNKITGGELPHNVSIPVAALKGVEIVGSYAPKGPEAD